jgi:hypothetical protein
MFEKTVERLAKTAWVREGWPLPQVVVRVMGVVITAATIYGYVSKPHGPGAAWWLAAAFAVVALWAISEMIRLKIRHRPPDTGSSSHPSFERSEHKTRSENWEVTEWEETRRGRDVAIEAAAASRAGVTNAAAGEVQFPVPPDSPTPPCVSQGDASPHHGGVNAD